MGVSIHNFWFITVFNSFLFRYSIRYLYNVLFVYSRFPLSFIIIYWGFKPKSIKQMVYITLIMKKTLQLKKFQKSSLHVLTLHHISVKCTCTCRLRQVSFCWTSHLISVLRTNQIRNCLLSNPMHSSCCVTPIPNNIVDLHLSFIKIHVPVIIFCWLPISVFVHIYFL